MTIVGSVAIDLCCDSKAKVPGTVTIHKANIHNIEVTYYLYALRMAAIIRRRIRQVLDSKKRMFMMSM